MRQLRASLDTSIGDVNQRLDSMGHLLAELRNFIIPQAPPPQHRDANGSANEKGDGIGVEGLAAVAPDLEGGRHMRVSSFHEDEASARAS